MAQYVVAVSVVVYLVIILLLILLTYLRVSRASTHVQRTKASYSLGQLPPASSYSPPSLNYTALLLWVTSIALLLAAAGVDQWSVFHVGPFDVYHFGLLTVRFTRPGESYTFADADPETQAAGILTLIFAIVALLTSCVGLVVYALYHRQQRHNAQVVQWWWNRKAYNWLLVARGLTTMVAATWLCLGGIPLVINLSGTVVSFNFGISWYLALGSTVSITVASWIAGYQIMYDRNVRSAMTSLPAGTQHQRYYQATQPSTAKGGVPVQYWAAKHGNPMAAPQPPRVPYNAPAQHFQPSPPPHQPVASHAVDPYAGSWWPRWTYWR